MKRPPLLLLVFTIAHLAFLLWELAAYYQPATLARLALDLVLFFLVFRGSRVAGNILAVFFAINALVLFVVAVTVLSASAAEAIPLAVNALLLVFSAYLFFSPAVRRFQGAGLC